VTEDSEVVETAKSGKTRKLHKAFLRYYDPENWPVLREGLQAHGPRRPDRQWRGLLMRCDGACCG
jgi:radical SAM superfamily enzyme YgiQ (UPF0313 family)